jgi:hypothetical protein
MADHAMTEANGQSTARHAIPSAIANRIKPNRFGLTFVMGISAWISGIDYFQRAMQRRTMKMRLGALNR